MNQQPLKYMSSKSIFITGAAAGIGKETALLFSEQGWYVGLFDIDESGLLALSKQIGSDKCCFQVMDVCDKESVKNALSFFTKQTNGTLNVLFNNAGIIYAGEIDEINLDQHKRLIDINVWGVLNCTVQALPYLKATPDSQIINMSSASALYGHPFLVSYAASKMAVRSMTEGLDIALKKYDIRVTDLMPLWVKTNLAQDAASQWKGLTMNEVQITTKTVARTVWKAAHGTKLHWLVGAKTKFYHVLGKLLPSPMMRLSARIILKE